MDAKRIPDKPKRAGTIVLACLVAAAMETGAAESGKLKALLLTGQNNHNWRETTPVLTSLLEQSGRFTVEITEHPETVAPERLSDFDVLISNWNAYGPATVRRWPDPLKKAFLDFVRDGGGFVVIHAGGSDAERRFQATPAARRRVGRHGTCFQ